MFEDFRKGFDVFSNPSPATAKLKKEASLMAGAMPLAKVFALFGVLAALFFMTARLTDFASIIYIPIILVILGLIIITLAQGVLYIVAKLLGGEGTFEHQFYANALFTAAFLILMAAVSIIFFAVTFIVGLLHISILSTLYALVLLVAYFFVYGFLAIYPGYVSVAIFMGVHGYRPLKAGIVMSIGATVIGLIIMGLIWLLMTSFGLGAMYGGSMANPYGAY